MRKFVLLCLIMTGALFLFRDYVQQGRLEKLLDDHYNPKVNPAVEYYWGILAALAGRRESAEYRFKRIIGKYDKVDYVPLAWLELINIYYDAGESSRVVDEGIKFLKQYPNHPKSGIVSKRITVIQHGY